MTDVGSQLALYEPTKFNVLQPKMVASQAGRWFKPSITVVEISSNTKSGDIYKVSGKDDDDDGGQAGGFDAMYALGKPALMRIGNAAGVIWDARNSGPVTAQPDYVLFKAVGGMRGPDGTPVVATATKEIDLRVIEAEIRNRKLRLAKKKNWSTDWAEQATQDELLQWRKNKLMRAETGAMERVIKVLLAIRSQFTLAELARPFVIVRYDINHDDPDVKKAFLPQAALAAQTLYGQAGAAIFTEPGARVIDADQLSDDELESQPVPTSAPDSAQAAPTSTPAADANRSQSESVQPAETASVPAQTSGLGQPTKAAPAATAEGHKCEDCGKKVSEGIAKFSRGKFHDHVYCMDCQKKAGATA